MNISCVEDLFDTINDLWIRVHCYGENVDLKAKLDELHYEIKDLRVNPVCDHCYQEILVPDTNDKSLRLISNRGECK